MSRFKSFFKTFQALDRDTRFNPVFYALIGLAFIAYVLPWVQNPGQALTMGGYDLAEWLSLHPGVRGQTPPLLASGLIRLHLPLLTALIVLWRPRGAALIVGVCVLLLAFAQFPPLEFLSHTDDINYRQQCALAILTVIVSAGLFVWPWRTLITLILEILGVVLCVVGLAQAREMMQVFKLPADIGIGAPLLGVVYLVMMGSLIWQVRQSQRV